MKLKERFLGPLPDYGEKRMELLMEHDPVMQQLFDDGLDELDEKLKPLTDAVEESGRITAKDLAIYIGPIPD